jgi:2-methylcitrate dehydratase PrpD
MCAHLTWQRLPAEVRDRATDLTLDLLGVAIRGSSEASSEPVRAVVRGYDNVDGSSGIGLASRLAPAAAALLNGTAAHSIELDDVTRESSLHPGVAVIPAAFAVAEQRGAPGRAFLEAVVAGYEVVIRVGNALNPASAYERGFHPTGVAGAFGAAAAAARVMGLDGAGIGRALGIAGTMASGSMEYLSDGSWTKRLNAGWAAHVGVMAAEFAAAGFTGPTSALEGRFGVLHAYTDAPRPELLTEGLGESYQITRVAIKPYACCRYNHGLIDGALRLRAEHAIDPAAVRRIRLGVLSAGAPLVAEPIEQKRVPRNPVDAQFSAPYATAIALVFGAAGAPEYRQQVVDDPRIRALTAVTDCYTSAELDARYPERWPAAVEIEMTDGRIHRTRVEFALGEPENPLSGEALRGKFRELVGDRLSAIEAQRLQDAILSLHAAPSVRHIADALRLVRSV